MRSLCPASWLCQPANRRPIVRRPPYPKQCFIAFEFQTGWGAKPAKSLPRVGRHTLASQNLHSEAFQSISLKIEHLRLTSKKGGYTSRPNPSCDAIFAVWDGLTSFLLKVVARAQQEVPALPVAQVSARNQTCLP